MAKQSRRRAIPSFRSEKEEREFWETHDTADYVEWTNARSVAFPNLKLSTETISLRLPAGLLAELKMLANRQDVPYQSLLKLYLAERVQQEWSKTGEKRATYTARTSRSGKRKSAGR